MKSLRLAVVLAWVTACGARTGGSSGPAGDTIDAGRTSTADPLTACTQYASAYRAYAARCPSGPSDDRNWDIHEARIRVACMSSIAMPGASLDADLFAGCAAALSTAACDARLPELPIRVRRDPETIGVVSAPPAACVPPLGRLANGTRCFDDAQCGSGICMRSTTSCGTCQPAAMEGGQCDELGMLCDRDAVCDFHSFPGHCRSVAILPLGGACGSSGRTAICDDTSWCDGATASCVARLPLGAPCAPPERCAVDLVCDTGHTHTCLPPHIAREGERCAADGFIHCAPGLTCSGDHTCTAITWVPPGGHCDAHGALCERGFCFGGVCANIVADGEPCDSVTRCDVLSTCVDGRCRLPGQSACE